MTDIVTDPGPPPIAMSRTSTGDHAAPALLREEWYEDLAMACHDLRNVLMVVQCTAEMWRGGGTASGRFTEDRTNVQTASERAVRLAAELFDLCNATDGRLPAGRRPVDLVGLVADAAESWRAAFESAGVWLSVEVPDDPVWLRGDRDRLARVLDNLLDNAAKYTGPAGHVTVCVGRDNGDAVLKVRDTGIGISPGFLANVFQPFSREDRAAVRSRRGSGVGLLAVRRIVEQHGGSVEAASPGPGRGSEFTVRLPASRPKRPRTTPPPQPASTGRW